MFLHLQIQANMQELHCKKNSQQQSFYLAVYTKFFELLDDNYLLNIFSLRADVIFSETSADVEWGKIKTMTLFRKKNRLSTRIQAKADKLYVQTLILDSYRLQYQKMNLKIIETKNWRTMNRIEEKNTNIYFYRNRKVNRRLLDRTNAWIQFYMA